MQFLKSMVIYYLCLTRGCSSMVEHQPSKLDTWVRFPSPAYFYTFESLRLCNGRLLKVFSFIQSIYYDVGLWECVARSNPWASKSGAFDPDIYIIGKRREKLQMTDERKKVTGHILACGTQIMWGATFVSTKVLLKYFLPVEILFTRAVLAFLALWIFFPHRLKVADKKRELGFAAAGFFGIVMYFMMENTALTMTYASNVGIIVACAPFFVAVMVGVFFKSERPGRNFFIGFVIAITGIILISLNGQKSLNLNPAGNFLAFLAMISWGLYSATVKKIEEWNYPTAAVTRRIYFYGIIFLIPVLISQHAMWDMDALKRPEVISNFLFLGVGASAVGFFLWNLSTKWIGAVKTSVYIYVSPVVTVVLSMFVLDEKMTVASVSGSILILVGLIVSQKRKKIN